jgi:hypothetical protein
MRVLLTSWDFVEVIGLEFAEFSQGDVDRRPAGLARYDLVSFLLQLKVGYFADLNSHLALKVSEFLMER